MPLVNGYSGYVPRHYAILGLSLRRGDTSGLLFLAREQPLIVVVNDRFDEGGDFRRLVEAIPSIEPLGTSGVGNSYRLPVQRERAHPPAGAVLADERHSTGREQVQLDLGASHVVDAVTFDLESRYPRLPERILIERSDDGQHWRQAWLGWTGGLAVAGALADAARVPISIPLDVQTRYLRVYPAESWLAEELKVRGR